MRQRPSGVGGKITAVRNGQVAVNVQQQNNLGMLGAARSARARHRLRGNAR